MTMMLKFLYLLKENLKRITLVVSPGGGVSHKYINVQVEWFTFPNVKLHDVKIKLPKTME